MDIVDLLDDETISPDMRSDRELNDELMRLGIVFFHTTLQKYSGVNNEMLAATPQQTVIVDAAAGPMRRFDDDQLNAKALKLVALDQDGTALRQREDASLKVKIDLNNLPHGVERSSLKKLLTAATHSEDLHQCRHQYRLLLEAATRDEIGLWIISQCLPGFSESSVQRLLTMASLNLHSQGSIFLFEAAKQKKVLDFATQAAAKSPCPLLVIRDEVLIPVLSQEQYYRMQMKYMREQQWRKAHWDDICMGFVHEGIERREMPIIRLPSERLPPEIPDFAQKKDSDDVLALGLSQRCIQLAHQQKK